MSEVVDLQVNPLNAIGLVAGREISIRFRSKAFRITTAIMLVLLVGGILVTKLLGGSTATSTVGFTPQTAQSAQAFATIAKSLGQDVTTRTVDPATGEQQIRNGDLDALLELDQSGAPQVVVKKEPNSQLVSVFTALAQQQALAEQITRLGGQPAQVGQAIASAKIPVRSLNAVDQDQGQQIVLGFIAGILIYVSLMIWGQQVAQGVIEEKSSRVVELLLSTLRPWQLMAGKVAGIGVVGLTQMVIFGVVGVAVGHSTGVLTISLSVVISTVIWLVVWYLLGFFAYALVFAAAGALVSRQEDAASATGPILALIIIPYVLGISILPSDPSNRFVEILSIIPTFAPTLMPIRLALGGVPVWEVIVSLALVIALIPVLVWFSGRIYRNAVLRSGARVKWRDALRPV